MDPINALQLSNAGLRAQSQRLRHISENIANVDTPGYRRKMVPFKEVDGLVEPGRVMLDRRPLPEVFDPAHPMANEQGFYQGSNVDLVIEIADAKEAQRSYEANLKMFEQSRQMSSALLDLIRR